MGEAEHTFTAELNAAEVDAAGSRAPMLFLVIECGRPAAGGARWCLRGTDSIEVGRGGRRRWARERSALHISLPDRHMSGRHARIARALGRWVLIDEESKNGIVLNGERVARASLRDGDVIEIGRCVFVFRTSMPSAADGATLESNVPVGLHTALPALERAHRRATDIARSDVPVLIGGESGTGKELVARALHRSSGRDGALIAVNCGALAPNLVESELFGHVHGAFSGATSDRDGYARAAHRGTLLLDEIGDLPLASQAAFLRFLQEREVTPVGSASPIPVDVRVVCATHRDLPAMVDRGRFRADLLARLSGYRMALAPLRDRREDLGSLVAVLLRRIAGDRADAITLSREAARALLAHDWPLNVRELEQALAAACALARADTIDTEHLPEEIRAARHRAAGARRPRELTEDEAERRAELVRLLEEHGGNISAVARAMGKARVQIHRWLKRYELDADQFR